MFKKKKQNMSIAENPMNVCVKLYREGVVFNNSDIIEKKKKDIDIRNFNQFEEQNTSRGKEILIRMTGIGLWTVWNEKYGFAKIIKDDS